MPRYIVMFLVVVLILAACTQIGVSLSHASGFGAMDGFDDFRRDLYGAIAVDKGETPYQRLATIDPAVSPAVADQWVAHPPATVMLAVLTYAFTGDIDLSVEYVRLAQIGLFVLVGLGAAIRGNRWLPLALLSSLAVSSFAANVHWNQHGLAFAVGLGVVLALEWAKRRGLALVLLGIIVALKPWLLPLAAVLPASRSAWRDLTAVCSVAGLLTLVALPVLGGPQVLLDWITVALPANLEQWRGQGGNRSAVAPLGFLGANGLFILGVAGVMPVLRRLMPRFLWPVLAWVVMMTLPQVVWDHYLVDAAPLLMFAALLGPAESWRGPFGVVLATTLPSFGLLMGLPVATVGFLGFAIGWAAAIGLVTLYVLAHVAVLLGANTQGWFSHSRLSRLAGVTAPGPSV